MPLLLDRILWKPNITFMVSHALAPTPPLCRPRRTSGAAVCRGADANTFAKVRFSALDFPTREGQGIKSFTFDLFVWPEGAEVFEGPFHFEDSIPSSGGARCFDMVGR